MMSKIYANYLKELCLEDKEIEKKVNESVLRILNLKNKLGLFENPYGNLEVEKEKKYIMNPNNLKQAKKLTQETFVLLKNENHILPLKENQKIALIGPYADNTAITGSWSMFSDRFKNNTILDVFQKRMPRENLKYAKGTEILRVEEINQILKPEGIPIIQDEQEHEKEKKLIQEAIRVGESSEIIVLFLGEHYKQSGEACSRSNIGLSEIQINLIQELSKLNKKMVMVLFNGRPIQLSRIEDKLDAILEVWFPGTTGAEAIVEVLLGEANPSGKLTMSFPQNAGQCPIYYNHYNTGRPHIRDGKYLSRYLDIPTESFYPFGYGLSYGKFQYRNLKLDKKQMKGQEKILVSIEVENESDYEGFETIQMYIQDLYASVVRPVKELKAFRKEFFQPREIKKIEFEINCEMLKFWNEKLEYVLEEGEFKVYVGSDSQNVLEEKFELIK